MHDARFRTFWPTGLLRGSLMYEGVRSPTGYEQSLIPARSARLVTSLGIGNGAVLPAWAKALAEQPGVASRIALRSR